MRALLSALAIIAIGGATLWAATDGARAVTSEGARRLHALEGRPHVPGIAMTDMVAEPTRVKAPLGGVALAEFIYTSCPTVCRYAGDAFAQIKKHLAAEGLEGRARLFSVSFDPPRDDPAALIDYADSHGADGRVWTVAAPAPTDVAAMLKAYGVTVIADDMGGFEHNAAIHLVDDQGRLSGIFDIDDVAGVVAAVRGWR